MPKTYTDALPFQESLSSPTSTYRPSFLSSASFKSRSSGTQCMPLYPSACLFPAATVRCFTNIVLGSGLTFSFFGGGIPASNEPVSELTFGIVRRVRQMTDNFGLMSVCGPGIASTWGQVAVAFPGFFCEWGSADEQDICAEEKGIEESVFQEKDGWYSVNRRQVIDISWLLICVTVYSRKTDVFKLHQIPIRMVEIFGGTSQKSKVLVFAYKKPLQLGQRWGDRGYIGHVKTFRVTIVDDRCFKGFILCQYGLERYSDRYPQRRVLIPCMKEHLRLIKPTRSTRVREHKNFLTPCLNQWVTRATPLPPNYNLVLIFAISGLVHWLINSHFTSLSKFIANATYLL